ncbi:hypothetical protein CCR75_004542 [Bremia lactucae]|uniref:Elicitin n=1 Tax=Bremia lactucae TaxID=4779 RepID=A0A976FIG2_BRELC|nr:hypothetical protein CCR75_004542 [Bremia lactucae]
MSATTTTTIPLCNLVTLSPLLNDQNLNKCADESNFNFADATLPTQDEINRMCTMQSCLDLLSAALALDPTECILPVGDNIRLREDLLEGIPARCPVSNTRNTPAKSVAANDATTQSEEDDATDDPTTAPSSDSDPNEEQSAAMGHYATAVSPVKRFLSVMSLGALAFMTYYL